MGAELPHPIPCTVPSNPLKAPNPPLWLHQGLCNSSPGFMLSPSGTSLQAILAQNTAVFRTGCSFLEHGFNKTLRTACCDQVQTGDVKVASTLFPRCSRKPSLLNPSLPRFVQRSLWAGQVCLSSSSWVNLFLVS